MNKRQGPIITNDRGFTLIEIMVAMALVSIMLFLVAGNTFSDRRDLDDLLSNVERTVRFSSDESGLKNQFMRLNFSLDGDEQDINLEYSDDKALVIDAEEEDKDAEEDLSEKELEEKKKKKSSFSVVPEFKENKFKMPTNVRIIGVATGLSKKLITEGNISHYFYPTGEKDSGIIIFATSTELAYLEIEPFKKSIVRQYVPIDENVDDENFQTKTTEMAEDIYSKWLKN